MRYFYLFALFFFFITGSGQRIQDFNVYDAGNGTVAVRFTISAGTPCYGFDVMHSTDSMVYNSVYNFPGQCGAQSEPSHQSWTHASPLADHTNYYKIQLLSPYETSEVRRIYVSQSGRSQTIPYPNPVFTNVETLHLKMPGTVNTRLVGFMYNRFGTTLMDLDLISGTGDIATVNVGGLADGLYVVWLTDGNNAYGCKFIVKR